MSRRVKMVQGFPKLNLSSNKRLRGWLKEDSPEVQGYIYQEKDGSFRLQKTTVIPEAGKLKTNAWATFHTHTMDCEEPEINCGFSPPSSTDVASFLKMAELGIKRHVVFGINETWIVVCNKCKHAERHLRKVEQLQARMKPGITYQKKWTAIMQSCGTCRVKKFNTKKYLME
jgi:hypothetical protein